MKLCRTCKSYIVQMLREELKDFNIDSFEDFKNFFSHSFWGKIGRDRIYHLYVPDGGCFQVYAKFCEAIKNPGCYKITWRTTE